MSKRYERATMGQVGFCYDLDTQPGYTFAEIEGEAHYECTFGEEPSGHGIHFDPGSGDEIKITAWTVDTIRRNPAWVKGAENPGIPYHLKESQPAPAWLIAQMEANAAFMSSLHELISETARNQRGAA